MKKYQNEGHKGGPTSTVLVMRHHFSVIVETVIVIVSV